MAGSPDWQRLRPERADGSFPRACEDAGELFCILNSVDEDQDHISIKNVPGHTHEPASVIVLMSGDSWKFIARLLSNHMVTKLYV